MWLLLQFLNHKGIFIKITYKHQIKVYRIEDRTARDNFHVRFKVENDIVNLKYHCSNGNQ